MSRAGTWLYFNFKRGPALFIFYLSMTVYDDFEF